MGVDLEALTIDPAIQHCVGGVGMVATDRPARPALANGGSRSGPDEGLAANSGPESLVRLSDGRFLVIEEGAARWRG